jgi:hypothetical protein
LAKIRGSVFFACWLRVHIGEKGHERKDLDCLLRRLPIVVDLLKALQSSPKIT